MNSIASKVWETLYPDRRPWDQLPEATQQEWSRMTDIVVDLTGARELQNALSLQQELYDVGLIGASHKLLRAVDESRKQALARAKEVLG